MLSCFFFFLLNFSDLPTKVTKVSQRHQFRTLTLLSVINGAVIICYVFASAVILIVITNSRVLINNCYLQRDRQGYQLPSSLYSYAMSFVIKLVSVVTSCYFSARAPTALPRYLVWVKNASALKLLIYFSSTFSRTKGHLIIDRNPSIYSYL